MAGAGPVGWVKVLEPVKTILDQKGVRLKS